MADQSTPGNLKKKKTIRARCVAVAWDVVIDHNDRHPQENSNAQERRETISVYAMRDMAKCEG